MTDHDETNEGWNDVHALSGAYAVDALDDVERARFEQHLKGCADCRAEVQSLQETAAVLGTEPVEPPAALRNQVLAGIESIRPLPPVVGDERPDQPEDSGDQLGERRRSRLPQLPQLPLLVAAAAVLFIAIGGALWLRPWAGDESAVDPTATERVLAADDAQRITEVLADGSQAILVVSRSEGRAVILTEDMAPAPAGKDYQLWLGSPRGDLDPAGLMPDQEDATVLLEGDASRTSWVGITIEPDGGSRQPTTDPIIYFELST